MGRTPRSEAEQRRELGGYTEAEFDREFVRSHRSDWASITTRVATLLIVYGLLARAIRATIRRRGCSCCRSWSSSC